MREKFETRNLSGAINVTCKFEDGTVRVWSTHKQLVVARIMKIVQEYSEQGYRLTLRQLHYQMVTQNWIVNHDSAYKKLGNILDDCRYSGVIDWDAIEDRGRIPYIPYAVNDVQHALQDAVDTYRIDRQRDQDVMVELWTEKDAISGILRRVTQQYHVRLVVNKGYTSSSAIYGAYERVMRSLDSNRRVVILYFGDHDPSGLDMIRDIRERLLKFICFGDRIRQSDLYDEIRQWWDEENLTVYDILHHGECPSYYTPKVVEKLMSESITDNEEADSYFEAARIEWYIREHELFRVIPIGLTMDQIKEFDLPPNPTKMTDGRAANYVAEYGRTCWEVDALKPQDLTRLVHEHIQQHIDMDKYNAMCDLEENQIEELKQIIEKHG